MGQIRKESIVGHAKKMGFLSYKLAIGSLWRILSSKMIKSDRLMIV
jgi:hypothetical protein